MPVVLGVNAPNTGTPVRPPDPFAPAMSLLNLAVPVEPENAEVARRWPAGFAFRPHSAWQAEVVDYCDHRTSNSLYPGLDGADYPRPASIDYIPFAIQHAEECSTFGFQATEWEPRALNGCKVKTASALEFELWSGELAQAKGYPNRYLASSAAIDLTPASGAVSPRRAMGLLEQALANAGTAAPSGAQATVNVSTGQPMGPGRRGMIHCMPEFTGMWGDLLRRDGRYLLTYLDTIVVPGSGYPGTGPDGGAPPAGTAWLYGTSIIHTRLTEPEIQDPDYLQHIDRATNTVQVRAQRFAAAYWDGAAHFAVLAQLEGPVGI